MSIGKLSIVATPIGNLGDITLRALEILKNADVIFCEDTRVTGKLLSHYQIGGVELVRADAAKEVVVVQKLETLLYAGKSIAYVSDAGTPGVSDPGARLTARARAIGAQIEAVPGASSVTAALSIAGLSDTAFTFLGFVPHKKGRETFFERLANWPHPVIFFESTHRIIKTLESLAIKYPDSTVRVARELTKLHEEFLVGTPTELLERLTTEPVKQKGEFVVIFTAE